jgi:hypothetical protein
MSSAVWCTDETFLGDLIYLNESNLVVDSPDDDKAVQIKDALLSGTPAAQVLSSDSTDIPLLSITSIKTDKNDDEIEIQYKTGKEVEDKTLRLASKDVRDDVYASLKAAFGDRFTETEDAYSIPQAAFASLMSLTVFGILTWAGAKFATVLRDAGDYEIEGSRQGLKSLIAWVLELLGPIGVYVVGGLICALCAFSLYSRVTQPQVMLVLQEEPYKRASKIMLGLKYLGMFAVWYIIARILF